MRGVCVFVCVCVCVRLCLCARYRGALMSALVSAT